MSLLIETRPFEPFVSPRTPKNYLTEARTLKSWLLTTDHKRIGILYLYLDPRFLLYRCDCCCAHSRGTHHAPRRSRHVRNLQQTLHRPRRPHGLVFSDPIHSGGARQFCDSDDDRRAGCRLSKTESAELVSFQCRRPAGALLRLFLAGSTPAGPFIPPIAALFPTRTLSAWPQAFLSLDSGPS